MGHFAAFLLFLHFICVIQALFSPLDKIRFPVSLKLPQAYSAFSTTMEKDFSIPEISVASESDMDAVLKMRRQEGVRAECKSKSVPKTITVVAKRGNVVVGACDIKADDDSVFISNLISATGHRKTGVATHLIESCCTQLNEKGENYLYIYLDVLITNKPAIKLYRNLNFETMASKKATPASGKFLTEVVMYMLRPYSLEDISWVYSFQYPTPKILMRKSLQ